MAISCRHKQTNRSRVMHYFNKSILAWLTVRLCPQEKNSKQDSLKKNVTEYEQELFSVLLTCVSTVLRHRRSLSATASGREGMLLLVALGSLITEPREPFTRWIRDLRRQDRACRDTDRRLFTVFYLVVSMSSVQSRSFTLFK